MTQIKINRLNKLTLEIRLFIIIPIIILLLFTSIKCSDQNSAGQFSMPPMPVEVAQVVEHGVSEKFEAVGTIEAIEEVTVVSEINATIVNIPFTEGSHINKGELIAQLDDSQLAAEVNRSEALYQQSLATYNRIKKIVEQKAGSQQDLDDALASLKVAEANLELAQARLEKTKIVAPFDGMIGSRKVSVGSFLRTGDAITELANLNEIRISFSAPERFLLDLKSKGNIIALEPIINSDTRTARIVARVQNPGQKFRPGMSANVSVILSERANALTIPTEAVFANGNQSFVYIINPDSTVAPTPVTLGLQLTKVVEVVSGLQQGMQIVTAGHQKLFPGAKVLPVNSQSQQQ